VILPAIVRFVFVPLIMLSLCVTTMGQTADSKEEKRAISLPWRIYRHFPADFSRWDEAAAGFRGWEAEVRELDLDRTCLVLMHFPERGLTPETEWGPDCRTPGALGTVEWVPRTMDVVTFRMPRLVKAAREAGLLVVHVGGAPGKGPVWEKSLAEAGDPPPPDPDRIARDEQRWARHTRDVFDLPRENKAAMEVEAPQLVGSDRDNILAPQPGDVCAAYSWQLHRLLKNRDVDHIIYCGWALNWCLWFSPGGMSDMSRKGYLCSAVRGGCVAIENRESAVGEKNLEYAYWKTSTMFGYVFDLHELTTALRKRAAAE
jgi:nicotinamidase-related amidase